MKPVLPGSTLGILGGGQLGRMLALAAKRLGYAVVTLDPEPESPCGQIADEQIVASFDDAQAAMLLADKCDVVTYEFERIDYGVVEALEAAGKEVRPGSRVLRVTQDRLQEKSFLMKEGVKVADHFKVQAASDLHAAARKIGFPAILKTAHGGYDGKGQAPVRNHKDAQRAFDALRDRPLVWERKIPFLKELSVVCARSVRGDVVSYPVAENIHVDNILDMSIVPARVSKRAEKDAKGIAELIAINLEIVGAFCVEMFLLEGDKVLVNEVAPRPHNSGHYTIDACATSQFEQQLRAVCGLPLGSPELLSPAVMVNLLGDGKGDRLTGVEDVLVEPKAHLHLYGKREARAARKMGHITVLTRDVEEGVKTAERVRRKLRWA